MIINNGYDKVDVRRMETVQRALLLLFAGFILMGQTAYAGQANLIGAAASSLNKPVDEQQHIISVNFNNKPLPEVLDELAQKVNAGISHDAEIIPHKSITYQGRSQSVYTVLKAVLEGTGLYITLSDNRKVVVIKEQNVQQLEKIQEVISGTVTDAQSGEPLPGVNISVEGTTAGTSTNAEGEYSLEVPGPESVLVFSFIGYKTQKVTVGEQRIIDVILERDLGRLDEVIVVGYGTQERRDLTGSVDRIEGEDFQNQSVTNVTDMLAGTIAGFNANQGTSAAGGSSLEIRGPTSLSAGTEPMVVLDGVVYNGSIRDINPNDIETIDVLKDASSAAVYGARAASGVILITTTKGDIGKPTIEFTSRVGRTEVASRNYGPRGPQDYIDFRTDYYRTVPTDFPEYHFMNPNDLPDDITLEDWRSTVGSPNSDDTVEWLNRLNFYGGEIENYQSGRTTDWFNEVMPPGLRFDNDLSIAGGTENARYYWSINQIDNEGIIQGDKFETIQTRLNLDFQVTDWLSAGINAQYANRDESVTEASLGQMLLVTPYGKIYDEDGDLEWFPGGSENAQNPLINTLGQERNRIINSAFSSIFAEFFLPYNITHKISFQPRIQTIRDYNFWSPETIIGGRSYEDGRATRLDFHEFEWMLDNLLTWEQTFGIHDVDLTLLYTVEEGKTWQTSTSNNTFRPTTNLGYSGIQFGINPSLSAQDTKVTGDGMMARLNYTLLDKYLLTASVRRDGYSAFGQENPRAVFPAVALAWNLSDESFFDIDLINQLKLRFSWGQNGNRDIGAYSSLAQLSANQFYNGSEVEMGVSTSSLANPSLSWEETESINFGVDVGMLDNRINLTLDYYDMTTTSLLVNRSLPSITGFDNVTTNLGELGNKGFEATIRTRNISSSNFNWRSSLNFSLNRNNIKSLYGQTGTYTLAGQQYEGEVPDFENEWFPGHSIHAVWDYDVLGMWQEEEVEQASEYNLRAGDVKARDLDDSGTYEALEDKRFIGHTEPRFRIGLRNEVDFLQNFSASLFVRADLGHILPFPQALSGWSTFDRRSTPNYPYWTPENRSNEWPVLSKSTQPFGGGIMLYKPASFVRIQNLSVSYNLPSELAQRILMQSVRVFGSARNLYSVDNWPGWDPESGHEPMPRTFTIGLSLSI